MNLPNKVTLGRFFLAIIYFIILSFVDKDASFQKWALDVGFIIFIIAALSDSLDGYLARRYNIETPFGRIADPFVDKIIVCGSFVFLASWHPLAQFIPAWIVVVILAREFIVHGLRSFAESKGIAFGSTFLGKQKMMIQCFTIGSALFYLGHLEGRLGPAVILHALVWVTLFSTLASGIVYLYEARKLFPTSKDI